MSLKKNMSEEEFLVELKKFEEKVNSPEMDEKIDAVQTAMENLVKTSDRLGIPFAIDPFGDFRERRYIPESAIKEMKNLESQAGNYDLYDDLFNIGVFPYNDLSEGWEHWSASSLTC